MKLGQNVCLNKIFEEMGHVGSKTTSLGQLLEKPSVYSIGHICFQILMKLGQNICLSEILYGVENRSYWVRN